MLRNALSAPSRAVRSSLRLSAQTPLPRPQFQSMAARAAPLSARWYGSETDSASKTSEAAAEATTNGNGNGNGADEVAAVKKQLEAKDAEAREWKDKYLRSVAESRNVQERATRDMKSARDFAIQKFAQDLVDSVDNFDRALAMVPEEKLKADERTEHLKDLVNLYEGLKMTERILMTTLAKHGLERFDPNGEKFNPNEHEATFMAPMADKQDNHVFHTQQKGFRLNGRILRPAKVGVVKNK
ncbi:GrpE-domain-containing protein [Podospora appendiculata]|uniref:GrpE protein homolog n=1 Tax=Podospora appendiculata TaxID=314037 RepID=A0AAE0X376_9PEZI|nr:GrpE-domain-containing protein [Podospora appendiculata]